MPTFTGKTFSSFFKNILGMNQSGNTGVDATTRVVHDGAGQSTSISLSDDVLSVQPVTDNTTGTMLVKNQSGSNILAVDTTNSRVLCGSSQINALTTYKTFNASALTPVAATHMVISAGSGVYNNAGVLEMSLGNGGEPAETLDVSAETHDTYNIVPHYWYLPDAITIMSAHVLMGGYVAADSALNFHLTSYDMDTSSNFGDLSGGVVVADSGATSAIDEDVIKIATMNNMPTDIAAGKVILATVESQTTSIISIQMIVKYHIQ